MRPIGANAYLQWNTMDNFEWINGFGVRLCLVYVDFKTQQRTPKLSAAWFREAAARNAVATRHEQSGTRTTRITRSASKSSDPLWPPVVRERNTQITPPSPGLPPHPQ